MDRTDNGRRNTVPSKFARNKKHGGSTAKGLARTRAGAEKVGGRRRRAASNEKVDYARLNEGQNSGDSSSGSSDDGGNRHVPASTTRGRRRDDEDAEYVASSGEDETGNAGDVPDSSPGVVDSDEGSVTIERGSGGTGQRKSLVRQSSRRSRRLEEKHRAQSEEHENQYGEREDEDEDQYQERSRRTRSRRVVADSASDEDQWKLGEDTSPEATKREWRGGPGQSKNSGFSVQGVGVDNKELQMGGSVSGAVKKRRGEEPGNSNVHDVMVEDTDSEEKKIQLQSVGSSRSTKGARVARSGKEQGQDFLVEDTDDDGDKSPRNENSTSRNVKRRRGRRAGKSSMGVDDFIVEDGDEEQEQSEEEEEEVGMSHAQLLYRQRTEDEEDSDPAAFFKNMAPSTSAESGDAMESFGWYIEFLAKAVEGEGKGPAFMERFCSNSRRNDFRDYRRAIKKFEDHLSTVRDSIVGGVWNQAFKAAIVSHPFVGFSELGPALCRSDSSDDEKHRCAACRRKQCSNVYTVYLAGCKYDADGMWTRRRWDKLLPDDWEYADDMEDQKEGEYERLELGGSCKYKSHLFHTLLHYKLYLVCKIRWAMDDEKFTP
ncbi:unnamed protein product, partial [Sphacelaria rigidula]